MFASAVPAVVSAMDAAHARVGAAHRELLALIAEADGAEAWVDQGARDMAHFVSIRYGISCWKARRWISAAYALEGLPQVAAALERGQLSLDKVVELTRFATPETESGLIRWAQGVSVGAILVPRGRHPIPCGAIAGKGIEQGVRELARAASRPRELSISHA